MSTECPGCGDEYNRLGSHLSQSDCDYPAITDRQHEIIMGLLLGDGYIEGADSSENSKPSFGVSMTNYDFLEWVDDELGVHSLGIKEKAGSEKSKKPYYRLRTLRSPRFERYLDWYPEGEYEAQMVDLTPLSLKMWFVSDGFKRRVSGQKSPQAVITNCSVQNRSDFFNEIFADMGLQPQISEDRIAFGVVDSMKLWAFMGESPPGFSHKWPSAKVVDDLMDNNRTALGGSDRYDVDGVVDSFLEVV